jgi:hypothetical protein
MPSKSETKSIKGEIRALKSALKHSAKTNATRCSQLRKVIRSSQSELDRLTKQTGSLEKATNERIAKLEGRLNS